MFFCSVVRLQLFTKNTQMLKGCPSCLFSGFPQSRRPWCRCPVTCRWRRGRRRCWAAWCWARGPTTWRGSGTGATPACWTRRASASCPTCPWSCGRPGCRTRAATAAPLPTRADLPRPLSSSPCKVTMGYHACGEQAAHNLRQAHPWMCLRLDGAQSNLG